MTSMMGVVPPAVSQLNTPHIATSFALNLFSFLADPVPKDITRNLLWSVGRMWGIPNNITRAGERKGIKCVAGKSLSINTKSLNPLTCLAVWIPTCLLHLVLPNQSFVKLRKFGAHSRRIWRAWDMVSFPVQENGLGFRRLRDVVKSYSCKLWWKWGNGLGIWSSFVQQVSWSKSFVKERLMPVDVFMRNHTLNLSQTWQLALPFFLITGWVQGRLLIMSLILIPCEVWPFGMFG